MTHNCALQRRHRKHRPKKGAPDGVRDRDVTEIEALVGGGAVDQRDLEAIETAARRDRALNLVGTSLSPAVTRIARLVGAMVSFASEPRHELASVDVDAKQVERTAEALGHEIAADERRVVEPSLPTAPTMYLGMDGTGVPMRVSELVGGAGKQPDGSAKTREVKLVTVWRAEDRDDEGTPVRDAGSVSYSAAIESAATRHT